MSLSQILLVLGRRWYVVALGLLLTLGLAYGALVVTPPAYEARGTILLMPSKEQLSTGGRNPFLQLDALGGPAGIVIARLSGDQARDLVAERAPFAEFGVEADANMRGPGIQAVVSDRSPGETLATLDFVLSLITDTLAQVQAEQGVPKSAIVGSMRLVVDNKAERVTTATVRSVVAALALGLLTTASLVFGIDALAQRRRRRGDGVMDAAPAARAAEDRSPKEAKGERRTRHARRTTPAVGEQTLTTPAAASPAAVPPAEGADAASAETASEVAASEVAASEATAPEEAAPADEPDAPREPAGPADGDGEGPAAEPGAAAAPESGEAGEGEGGAADVAMSVRRAH